MGRQPSRALFTPLRSCAMPTRFCASSNEGQALGGRTPSTILTPMTRSETVTIPLLLQSPTQETGVGVVVSVAVSAEEAVGMADGTAVAAGDGSNVATGDAVSIGVRLGVVTTVVVVINGEAVWVGTGVSLGALVEEAEGFEVIVGRALA